MSVTAAPRTATKRFAVVGHPIKHSRSPEIFAALSAASGIPLTYERIELTAHEFGAAFAHARAAYDGWNVTAPHKARAIAAADDVTADAGVVGAANVIVFRHGRAHAANTDVGGVSALLAYAGADPRGATVTVLGAGGAARAAVMALAHGGASTVTVHNRTPDHAHTLVDDLRHAVGRTALLCGDVDESSSIVINATSDGGAVASAVEACAPDGWCIDLQYKPSETPFVRAARAAGRRAVNGTPMLVAQAIATFRLWFGDVPFDDSVEVELAELVEAS
jgi:shikimate dehydrogenase